MPRHLRIKYVGAKYHVTSRGNGREKIFYSDDDRERFLEQLDAALVEDGVILYEEAQGRTKKVESKFRPQESTNAVTK